MSGGPEQHAATVREARSYIESAAHEPDSVRGIRALVFLDAFDAALDELVALAGRAEELEQMARGYNDLRKKAEARADELQAKYDKDVKTAMGAAERFRAQGLKDKARADELQRERDAAVACAMEYRREREQARREADQLRAALEDLLSNVGGHNHWDSTMRHGAGCETCIRQREAKERARAALAGVQAEEEA